MGRYYFVKKQGDRFAPTVVGDSLLESLGFGTGEGAAIQYAIASWSHWMGPYPTRADAIRAANDANKGTTDHGREETDRAFETARRRMAEAYEQAAREMDGKAADLLKAHDAENQKWQERVRTGEATQEEYRKWCEDEATDRAFVNGMARTLARDAVDVDRLARDYINDEIPQVYAENANYAAYEVESGIGWDTHSFDLYDQSTVRRLIMEQPNLVPMVENEDGTKDYRWNVQKFSAAITQSVLQGESIPNTAERLRRVLKMDENAAVRAARTAMTSAENAGRIDSYKRAERIGIKLEQQWMATRDERTRWSHRQLDGQHVPVGKPFKVNGDTIRFPADPQAKGYLVWNCRCTLVAWTPEMAAADARDWDKMPDGTSYEEWKARGAGRPKEQRQLTKDSPIWSQCATEEQGRQVRQKVDELLAGSHGRVSELWQKYEGQLTLADPVHKDKNGRPMLAYYTPYGARGVYMTVERSLANVENRGTLATWFHEFGHHIDNIVGGRSRWESYEYKDNLFGKTLRDEVSEYANAKHQEMLRRETERANALPFEDIANVRDLYRRNVLTYAQYKRHAPIILEYDMVRELTKEQARDEYGMTAKEYDSVTKAGQKSEKAIRSAIARRASRMELVYDEMGREITQGGLSTQLALGDIVEGATKGRAQDTYGHGKGYWKDDENLALEAFAEFHGAECIYSERPEILDKMIERFPRSYAVYQDIVTEMIEA